MKINVGVGVPLSPQDIRDITLKVVPAGEARAFIESQPDPDAKTLLSLAYAGL